MTPQRLHADHLTQSVKCEDIVHALWRHGDKREQGSRIGRCGWITSFLIFYFINEIKNYPERKRRINNMLIDEVKF
jgi:hypothetical protein